MGLYRIVIASDVPCYQEREVEAAGLEDALKHVRDIAENELGETDWDEARNWRVVEVVDEGGKAHMEGVKIKWVKNEPVFI